MRKPSKFYPLNFEEVKTISAKAVSVTFLVPGKDEKPDQEFNMVLPKSQIELDEDTSVIYATSWILKQKIKNEDQGYGVAPQFFIDWLMDEIDWEEGDEPDA